MIHFVNDVFIRRKKKFNRIIGVGKNQKSAANKIDNKTLFDKLRSNPVCYLTGRKIDLNETKSYEFDHIKPISRGGDNALDNLGLTCRQANRAKGEMTPEEFVVFCQEVVDYHKNKTRLCQNLN